MRPACVHCDEAETLFEITVPEEIALSCLEHLGLVVGELAIRNNALRFDVRACDELGALA